MKGVLALVRAQWRSALSYRLQMVLSVAGLLVSIVPLYFVATALQPTMAPVIEGQGSQYFSFLVLGMVALNFVVAATTGIPRVLDRGIRTGTLEAIFGTPMRTPHIVAGLAGYDFLWSGVRSALYLLAAVLLGAAIVPAHAILATGIFLLLVLAHVPFGLFAAALLLAFRTTASIPRVVGTASALLGGAYYPTEVIPSWIEIPSHALPLTYGLRALRRVALEGEGPAAVAGDVATLALMTALLLGASALALSRGLRYARRNGHLAIY